MNHYIGHDAINAEIDYRRERLAEARGNAYRSTFASWWQHLADTRTTAARARADAKRDGSPAIRPRSV
ncbi:hypothetical protein GCM10022247_28820 [Allokutzneria multivorans]|uniref:Integrase n=1 Tax=Allokutzneria multivorans TaxID=1142134 RepID=A0ABP7S213_9PSEU